MADVNYIEFSPARSEGIRDLNLSQFDDSPNLNGLLDIIKELGDELTNNLVDISNGWLLARAEGDQLTYLGEELDAPRGVFQEDEEYKLFLYLLSKYRNSDVSRNSIVEAISLISGEPNPNIYQGRYKTIDITFQLECESSLKVAWQLERFFPILTNLTILVKKSTPFGFEGDNNTLGFGTVTGNSSLAGSLVSIVLREVG